MESIRVNDLSAVYSHNVSAMMMNEQHAMLFVWDRTAPKWHSFLPISWGPANTTSEVVSFLRPVYLPPKQEYH